MNALNQRTAASFAVFSIVSNASPQDQLRGIMTTGFGDVAAIKQRAEAGDAKAQVALADSLSAAFHSVEALGWYRKAAAQGNTEGAYQVGRMLLFGMSGLPANQSVKPARTEGIHWTFIAATNLDPHACRNMAQVLQRGLGVSSNIVASYAWLQLFADSKPGFINGRVELNQLALRMDSNVIAQVQTGKARWPVRRYQQRFARRDGGPQRLSALLFAKTPSSWSLPK